MQHRWHNHKKKDKLPVNLVADEKHTTLKKDKVYIATTCADNCILGASVCQDADEQSLTKGYGTFADEAKNIDPDYQPESVNLDGWEAGKNAFNTLFTGITVIHCFLHGFIKIRDRCRKSTMFGKICGRVWHTYKAEDKQTFSQRMRRLKEWATSHLTEGGVLTKINALCDKSPLYQRAYDHPEAYRTSNMVDRIMRWLDRSLFAQQYFHGTLQSSDNSMRAWALFRNHYPYCLRKVEDGDHLTCAASDLNEFVYSDNWLDNLNIASSMNGYRQ